MNSKEEAADHAVVPDHLRRKMMSILRFHACQERGQNERGDSSWRGSLWISAMSRSIGILLTNSGRRNKVGKMITDAGFLTTRGVAVIVWVTLAFLKLKLI